MRFMNTWDIDEAVIRYQNNPVLGPAAKTLASLRDAADNNSDGWAYWPKPARSAARLMEIIELANRSYYRSIPVEFTADEINAAMRPIKAFRTRSGLDFEVYNA